MKIKRYFAADMRQALQMVGEEQGPDAVILSNRRVEGGVEIVAAVDYDEALVNRMAEESEANAPRESAAEGATAEGWDDEPEERLDRPRSKEKARVVWSQDPALVAMRQEIQTLRGILESQLSGLAWSEAKKAHPFRAKLLQRLVQLGLRPQLCTELADKIDYSKDMERNWRQALGLLSRRLPVTDDDILTRGGIVALVGPTGVGKTTSVAKLAARYALRHGTNSVALVTTDSYRIGAHQQLRTYGRILGVPVHVAGDVDDLKKVLGTLRDKSLILVDTAGTSQRDVRLVEQTTLLSNVTLPVRTYVVLSTTTQRAALEETVRAFERVELDGCILSKVDETASLGEALSVVEQYQLPVAYVSDGQRVPEDLRPARANNLITRSVSLMKDHGEVVGEEALAFTFGSMVSNAHG